MGKPTISMAIFNSFLLVYQRVNCSTDLDDARGYPHDLGKPAYPAYWHYSMVRAGSWRQDKRHLVPGMSWNNLLGPPQFCFWFIPSGKLTVCYWKWSFMLDLLIFHSYVSLPEGKCHTLYSLLPETITNPPQATRWNPGFINAWDSIILLS